jgi:hypothetical protein
MRGERAVRGLARKPPWCDVFLPAAASSRCYRRPMAYPLASAKEITVPSNITTEASSA